MGNDCPKGPATRGTLPEAPGSFLDRILSGGSDEGHDRPLYRLADYRGGGQLLEVLRTAGPKGVEALLRGEVLRDFLYEGGEGRTMTRTDYLRWALEDERQDHFGCWQLPRRGRLGETLLHVLLICNTREHLEVARILLKAIPKLCHDVIEGEEFLGVSALHLAIANADNQLAAMLVRSGASINQRATGTFFLPYDQQGPQPSKVTSYEAFCYMGEYPLCWAACMNNETMYNYLLDRGADPELRDSLGNSVLHVLVVNDNKAMYRYVFCHPKRAARRILSNKDNLTPLTLACKLGRSSMFCDILEFDSVIFWKFCNISLMAYPLNLVDTILPDGSTNWNSAFMIILRGGKEEHLNMLEGSIFQKLLEEKWSAFARSLFKKRLILMLVHLTSLSIAVYLRVPVYLPEDFPEVDRYRQYIRYAFEMASIASSLSYLFLQVGKELCNHGISRYLQQLSHNLTKSIFLFSNLLVLMCVPCRLLGYRIEEETLLIIAIPSGWFYLMFFAGSAKLTGPFVTMIHNMITNDMFIFCVIYLVFLFIFTQPFFFLHKDNSMVRDSKFSSYHATWMGLFHMTLGEYDYSSLESSSYPNLTLIVFASFFILVVILLLNMFIAMMGNTYATVTERSEKEWMRQWANIVIELERSMTKAEAKETLKAYSINLGEESDGMETMRLLIIVSKKKTRAKQRKGALLNWKRAGKLVIQTFQEKKCTADQLRSLIWKEQIFDLVTTENDHELNSPSSSSLYPWMLQHREDGWGQVNGMDLLALRTGGEKGGTGIHVETGNTEINAGSHSSWRDTRPPEELTTSDRRRCFLGRGQRIEERLLPREKETPGNNVGKVERGITHDKQGLWFQLSNPAAHRLLSHRDTCTTACGLRDLVTAAHKHGEAERRLCKRSRFFKERASPFSRNSINDSFSLAMQHPKNGEVRNHFCSPENKQSDAPQDDRPEACERTSARVCFPEVEGITTLSKVVSWQDGPPV